MKKMDISDITVNLEQICAVLNLTIDALTDEIECIDKSLEKEGRPNYFGHTRQLILSFCMALRNLYDLTEECEMR